MFGELELIPAGATRQSSILTHSRCIVLFEIIYNWNSKIELYGFLFSSYIYYKPVPLDASSLSSPSFMVSSWLEEEALYIPTTASQRRAENMASLLLHNPLSTVPLPSLFIPPGRWIYLTDMYWKLHRWPYCRRVQSGPSWYPPYWRRRDAGDRTSRTWKRIGGIYRICGRSLPRLLWCSLLSPMMYPAPLPPWLRRGRGREWNAPTRRCVVPGWQWRYRTPHRTE